MSEIRCFLTAYLANIHIKSNTSPIKYKEIKKQMDAVINVIIQLEYMCVGM